MILDKGKTNFPKNLLAVGRVDLLRTSISSRSAAVACILNSCLVEMNFANIQWNTHIRKVEQKLKIDF